MSIRRGYARVLFNEGAFAEDVMRSGRAGAKTLREARDQFAREGIAISSLRRCDSEGRDGTKLAACFKVYLPAPNGKFGMVLRFIHDGQGFGLRYLAFGVRHQPRDPAERLESQTMREVLARLKERYELVVVDTAPVGVVSDAFPLLRQVAAVYAVGDAVFAGAPSPKNPGFADSVLASRAVVAAIRIAIIAAAGYVVAKTSSGSRPSWRQPTLC